MGRNAVFRSLVFWSFAPVATLLHTGIIHLTANLWCLVALGPFLERRQGSITILLLWVIGAYVAMGVEVLVGGVGRIGLSAFTYALLGAALYHWSDTVLSPSRRYTALTMLAFLLAGAVEMLGIPSLLPDIAHVAHGTGLLAGFLLTRMLPWHDATNHK